DGARSPGCERGRRRARRGEDGGGDLRGAVEREARGLRRGADVADGEDVREGARGGDGAEVEGERVDVALGDRRRRARARRATGRHGEVVRELVDGDGVAVDRPRGGEDGARRARR